MKPQILFISNPANYTGAPLYLYGLLCHLDRGEIWEKAILLRGGGELTPLIAELHPTYLVDGTNVMGLPPAASQNFSSVEAFYAKFKPDLVYSNTITNGQYVKLAHDLHVPVILHVQEMKPAFEKHTAGYLQDTLACAHFICVSNAVREYLRRDYGVDPRKLSVVHNSIDTNRIDKLLTGGTSRLLRKELGIPEQAIVFGGIGAVALHKGVDLWLQVARRVVIDMVEVDPYFVWVGQDTNEYAMEMKRNVASLGLSERVLFTGATVNPYPFMQMMDIFIMSSRYESIGLVNIEAAYLAIPIVCFGCAGGPREVVEPDAGLVVESLDTYEMALAAMRLAQDKKLRINLGSNGHQRACQYFNIVDKSTEIEKIINMVMSSR